MNIENTKAQMRKGVLEFCILSVLKEKDAYKMTDCSTTVGKNRLQGHRENTTD